jgi:LacI family transcriptional regulator
MSARVLVILDTSLAWSRGILRGFASIANERGWDLLHYHPGVDFGWLVEEFAPDVAVLGPSHRGPWPEVLRSCISVAANRDYSDEGIASVCLDERRVAELALAHLQSRGLKRFTAFRFNGAPFAVIRERDFYAACRERGVEVAPGWWSDSADPSEEQPKAIEAWLNGLPKPCGLFTCCDSWGRVVARYARVAGLRVPEDLALVGVDNDVIECELIAPPLSSVAVPWLSLGEKVAGLVQRGLAGESISGERIVIEPLEVVARRSSDTLAIDDQVVRAAVAWIQAHTDRRVTVPMVADAVNTTRQRLERRFRANLGRTVMQEVRRAHVEAAKRLQSTTRLTLPEIARRTGFTNPALLNEAFRREVDLTPGEYRRRAKASLEEEA